MTARSTACVWCGCTDSSHDHYTVLCYQDGVCLGRLGSDGYAVRRKIHAAILGKDRANQIAAEINADGDFTAKIAPF